MDQKITKRASKKGMHGFNTYYKPMLHVRISQAIEIGYTDNAVLIKCKKEREGDREYVDGANQIVLHWHNMSIHFLK